MSRDDLHFLPVDVYVSTNIIWKNIYATLGQSGSGNNGNERELHIPQISRTETSTSDGFVSYIGYSSRRGVLPFCWDAVSINYSPGRLEL